MCVASFKKEHCNPQKRLASFSPEIMTAKRVGECPTTPRSDDNKSPLCVCAQKCKTKTAEKLRQSKPTHIPAPILMMSKLEATPKVFVCHAGCNLPKRQISNHTNIWSCQRTTFLDKSGEYPTIKEMRLKEVNSRKCQAVNSPSGNNHLVWVGSRFCCRENCHPYLFRTGILLHPS